MSGGQTLVLDYDKEGDKFVVNSHHEFNFGPYGPSGIHTPSSTPDGSVGIITKFDMNTGMENPGWNQIMSRPRQLSLIDGDSIGKDMLKVVAAGDV